MHCNILSLKKNHAPKNPKLVHRVTVTNTSRAISIHDVTTHPEKWQRIISAIKTNTLSSSHLIGTCFERLIDSTIGQNAATDYSSLLSGLLEIPTAPTDTFYCHYDSDEQTFTFATNQDDLKSILARVYTADTPWSDMDTDDLELYLNSYEDEGHEITYFSLDHTTL